MSPDVIIIQTRIEIDTGYKLIKTLNIIVLSK